ncbi:MAG: DEAD/DEAH box helicase [Actinobacteria bacterium]|nr:DEAD/DEAH box helicase [Actinomycetota bacterium]
MRLIEWFGNDVLNGASDDVRALAETPWGFYGFSDDELELARTHPAWDELFEHQREGVEYMFCNPHGSTLCALSWGMGKAATSIVAADLMDAQRILVLAPLTLAPAWTEELQRWSALHREVKRSVAGDRTPGPGVTIANHEVIQEVVLRDEHGEVTQPEWTTNARRVKAWREEGPKKVDPKTGKAKLARERIVRVRRDYLAIDWDLIIVDESVLLKNRKAVKADVLTQLRKGSDPFMFLLSGSPTTKYRDDLFRQMQIMFPRGFTSYWRFAEFFCVVDKDGWGWTIEGDRPENDPHHYLRDFMWVKSQDEALPDLPEYIVNHVPIEPLAKQRKALDQMIDEWVVELEDEPSETIVAENWLSRTTRLAQITSNMGSLPKPSGGFYPRASAKEDLLIDMINQGDIETPLLVWSWFVETTHSIADRLRKAAPHLRVGSVVGKDKRDGKDATIAQYKADELDVLVMQMSTGKFGHTFTHTKTVFYHDRAFDSDAWVQSLARVRRIGLAHTPVLIVPKVIESADQLVDANLEGKLQSIARMTNGDLARLLRSLRDDD